jgi:filamentous hemagglutinin family protein
LALQEVAQAEKAQKIQAKLVSPNMSDQARIRRLPNGSFVMLRRRKFNTSAKRFSPRSLSLALADAFSSASSSLHQAITGLSITLAGLASMQSQAQSLPQGGVAVHGTANIVQNGNTLNVTTTNGAGGNTSAIHWQSFNIGAGNTTNIIQPNAVSTSLNRVVTNVPTQIHGALNSNGKVIIVNQNGIAVGAGGVVDTAGFTASTLNISDADYKAGRMRFEGSALSGGVQVDGVIRSRNGNVVLIAPQVATGKDALVKAENGNVILAAGQSVELTGRGLEGVHFIVQSPEHKVTNLGNLQGNAVGIFGGTLRHSGTIQAQTATLEGGKVVLRALGNVTIERDGASGSTPVISANGGVSAGGVAQNGGNIRIESTQGNVSIGSGSAISANAGLAPQINAQNMPSPLANARGGAIEIIANGSVNAQAGSTISATGHPGGTIRIYGGLDVRVGASINASAPSQGAADAASTAQLIALQGGDAHTGGSIQILSPNFVSLESGAQLVASGDAGGGTILVGGDYQGANLEITNALNTNVSKDVLLEASARVQGDGGRIVVWADNNAYFGGNLVAKGGEQGGNGGFGETSGKNALYFRGRADLGARRGRTGTLLLDPAEILIQGGGSIDASDIFFLDEGIISAADNPGANVTIYEADIESIGLAADIVLEASRRITFGGTAFNDDLKVAQNLTLRTTNAVVETGSLGILFANFDAAAMPEFAIRAGGDIVIEAGTQWAGGSNGPGIVTTNFSGSTNKLVIESTGGSVIMNAASGIGFGNGTSIIANKSIDITSGFYGNNTGVVNFSSFGAPLGVKIQGETVSIEAKNADGSISFSTNTEIQSIGALAGGQGLQITADNIGIVSSATGVKLSSGNGILVSAYTDSRNTLLGDGTAIGGGVSLYLAQDVVTALTAASNLQIGDGSYQGNISVNTDGVNLGNLNVALTTGGAGAITNTGSTDKISMGASGSLYAQTETGDIDLSNSANAVSRFSAQTASGSVTMTNGGPSSLTIDSIRVFDGRGGKSVAINSTVGTVILSTQTANAGIVTEGADLTINTPQTPTAQQLLITGASGGGYTISTSSSKGSAGNIVLPEIAAKDAGLTLNILAQSFTPGTNKVSLRNVSEDKVNDNDGSPIYLDILNINTNNLNGSGSNTEVLLPSQITVNKSAVLEGLLTAADDSSDFNISTLADTGSITISGSLDSNTASQGTLNISSEGSVKLSGTVGATKGFNNVNISAKTGNIALEGAQIRIDVPDNSSGEIKVNAGAGDINIGSFSATGNIAANTTISLTAGGSVLNPSSLPLVVEPGGKIDITAGQDIGSSANPVLTNSIGSGSVNLLLDLNGESGVAFVTAGALTTNLGIESASGGHSFDVKALGTGSSLSLSQSILGDDNITLTSNSGFDFGASSINAASVSITTQGQISTQGLNAFDIGATSVVLAAGGGIGANSKAIAINADAFNLSVENISAPSQENKIFIQASAKTGSILRSSQFALNSNNLAEFNLTTAPDVTEVLINGNQLGNANGINVNVDAGAAKIGLKPDAGAALVFDGAGQFTLKASEVIIDSTVVVNNTLVIDAASNITANGQLTGSGIYSNAGYTLTALAGSTIAPGVNDGAGQVIGAGNLTITGNLSFQENSLLRIYVAPDKSYSKLNVTSDTAPVTTSLNGNLRLVSPGQLDAGTYLVIDGNSTVSGSMVLEPIGLSLSASIDGSTYRVSATVLTNVWLNVTGDWDNPLNWSLGRAPQNGDIVVINPTGAQTITVDEFLNLNNYTLNFSGADDTIFIATGGFLNILNGATLNGQLTVNGGNLNFVDGTNIVNNLSIVSGAASIGGKVDVNSLSWTGGELRLNSGGLFTQKGPSALTVSPQSTLIYSGGGLANTLSNQGNVFVLSGVDVIQELDAINIHTGKFDISSGGRLDLLGNAKLDGDNGSSAITGGGALVIQVGATLFMNDTVDFRDGRTLVSGTLVANSNFTTGDLNFEKNGVLNGSVGSSSVVVLNSFSDTATAGFGTNLKSVSITQDTGNLTINRDLSVNDALFLQATGGNIETLSTNGVSAKSIDAIAGSDVAIRSFSTNLTTVSATSTDGDISLGMSGALTINGISTAAGKTASVTATGAVNQSTVINTSGKLEFDMNKADLRLSNFANKFGEGIAIVDGGQVELRAADDNSLSVSGDMITLTAVGKDVQLGYEGLGLSVINPGDGPALQVNASGSIDQGGVLYIAGQSNLQALAGPITLLMASTYTGSVQLIAGTSASIASNSSLNLAEVSAPDLTVNSSGAVAQTAGSSLRVSNQTTINAADSDITLNQGPNSVRLFSAVGNNINLVTDAELDPNILATGNVRISSSGGINQAGGNKIVAASVNIFSGESIRLLGANKLGALDVLSTQGIEINDVGASLTIDSLSTYGSDGIKVTSTGALNTAATSSISSDDFDAVVSLTAASIGSSNQMVQLRASKLSLQATTGDVYVRNNASTSELTGASAVGTLHYETTTGDGYAVTGNVSAAKVELFSGGNLDLGSFDRAVTIAGSNSVLLDAMNVRVSGGSQNGASTTISSNGSITINSFGNFVLQGGSKQDAYAQILAAGPVTLNVGSGRLGSGMVDILGGAGDNAYALLDPTSPDSVLTINSTGAVNLQGGAGADSYAAVKSVGDIVFIGVPSLNLLQGSGADADAVLVSMTGNTRSLPSICTGCLNLITNPLGNGKLEAGVYNGAVVMTPLLDPTTVINPVIGIGQIGAVLEDVVDPDDRLPGQDPEIVVDACP